MDLTVLKFTSVRLNLEEFGDDAEHVGVRAIRGMRRVHQSTLGVQLLALGVQVKKNRYRGKTAPEEVRAPSGGRAAAQSPDRTRHTQDRQSQIRALALR